MFGPRVLSTCGSSGGAQKVAACALTADGVRFIQVVLPLLGSQHLSPNVKTFCNFEPQIWPEIITSRDAESTCFKGSRTSCDVISFGIFWLNLRTPPPATEPRDGPTWNFHEKFRKNNPRPEILDSRIMPRKYRKNTPKIPKIIVLVFFRYFWGISWGSKKNGLGPIFSVFFVESPGRAISGLCSRQGHSQG